MFCCNTPASAAIPPALVLGSVGEGVGELVLGTKRMRRGRQLGVY